MVEKKKADAKAKSVDKWKRKKLFVILSPKLFGRKEIAETVALKEKNVLGRTVVLTLDKLTGNRTQRHLDVRFKVTELNGLNAETEIIGHEIKHSYLGRIVRRRRSKIVSIGTFSTKDGKRVRVTAMSLTARKVKRNKEKEIRKLINEEINKTALRNSSDKLIEEILAGSLAARIFKSVRNVTVLKRVEILKSKIVKGR